MLTAAVRDLKRGFPGIHIGVKTPYPYLWENNPYIENITEREAEILPLGYKTPYQDLDHPDREHFIYAFHRSLEQHFGIRIPRGEPFPDITLFNADRKPLIETDKPIILVNAGSKSDFPVKQWPRPFFQQVVNALKDRYAFVQIGETRTGNHRPLSNVINMLDKTPQRAIIRLMYHSAGVITGVSFPMHLCAAINAKEGHRCLITLAGRREDTYWEKYPDSIYLQGSCSEVCEDKGCWKRFVPPLLEYTPELCKYPIRGTDGGFYAKCLTEITPDSVVENLLREIPSNHR